VKAVKRTSFLTKLAPQLLEAMCGLAVEKSPFHSLTSEWVLRAIAWLHQLSVITLVTLTV
jgi:hypothetical protein